MPIIEGDRGDKVMIRGRAGIEYTDENGMEYFVDGEMIVSENYDYTLFPDSIVFMENHSKETNPENQSFLFHEDNSVDIIYKQRYPSSISIEDKNRIAERIKELCYQENMKILIIKS